jgi:hypothetical protein
MASNGINDLGRFDFVSDGMYPGSQNSNSYYANATQMPLGAQAVQADYDPATNPLTGEPVSHFAKGGIAALHFDGTEGSDVQDPTSTEPTTPPTMAELADQLKLVYRSGINYDDLWKQFAATKEQDPAQWYKHQLDFLGQQQGWQIGQNRSDRLSQLQPQINDTIEQAKAAGLSEKEINSILSSSSQEGNVANQQRIATLSEAGGSGFNFSKDVRPGLGYLAAATAAAATANPEILGLGETGAVVGAPIAEPALGITTIAPEAATTTGGVTSLGADATTSGLTAAEMAAGSGTPATSGLPAGQAFTNAEIAAGTGSPLTSGLPASQVYGPSYAALGYTGAGTPETAAAIAAANAGPAAGAGMTTKDALLAYQAMNIMKSGLGGDQTAVAGQAGPTTTTTTAPKPASSVAAIPMMGSNQYGSLYTPYTYDYTRRAAQGGLMNGGGIASLGSYSDGGQLLKGPGDGMSDDIPASIGQDQPARLADGEFVIPADVVSHLGNGSTDAGAKHLYKMMDRIRQARTGNHKQGKKINPEKFLPQG